MISTDPTTADDTIALKSPRRRDILIAIAVAAVIVLIKFGLLASVLPPDVVEVGPLLIHSDCSGFVEGKE